MAHPNDIQADGRCRVCRDKLSKVIRKKNGKHAFRKHQSNPNCPTKGSGEPIVAVTTE